MTNFGYRKLEKQFSEQYFDKGFSAEDARDQYIKDINPEGGGRVPTLRTIYNWKRKYDLKESTTSSSQFKLSKVKQVVVKKEFGNMFAVFNSKNISDMNVALESIGNYIKSYGCMPDEMQLNMLIPHIKNIELRYDILRIIFMVMEGNPKVFKKINEKKLREELYVVLNKYKPDTYDRPTVEYIFFILGHYNDHVIVDRLVQDARQCKPEMFDRIRPYYAQKYTVSIIEKCRSELFETAKRLRKEGKNDAASFIQQIVNIAIKNVNNPSFKD